MSMPMASGLYTPIVQSTHYCPSATAVVPHTTSSHRRLETKGDR